MTRAEFDLFMAEAARRGFSHVISLDGPVSLAKWSPYNCYGKPGDGALAELLPVPTWVNDYQAEDFDRSALPEDVLGCMWTFLKPDQAQRMIDHDAQQPKGRRR